MNDDSVTAEIHRLIDDRLASGVIVNADWVAYAVLDVKAQIEGEDAPFYRVCAFKVVSKMVRRAIGKYATEDNTPEQLVLDGFRYLAKGYPIQRGEVIALIPVDLCTDDELLGRAEQLDEMAKGCRAHAREIREYVMARPRSEAA